MATGLTMEYVEPFYADQHLTRNGGKRTLCGYDREDIRADIPFHDHREGYILSTPEYRPCGACADEADRIQNGPRR
jgi:hypothetical protein